MVDPSVDNMLKITSDGRKLGLDQRLMNPLLPDAPNSKLNACVRNVLRIYEEGQSDKMCIRDRSHSDGTYQQLNFMSLFQSEAEQIQKIDAAAENAAREAESEKPSAFVISEDEIDRMLRAGSNFEGGKIRIYVLYQQQGDAKERAAFLKAEYGLGGHSYTFMDGSRGFADYDGKGILLRNYGHDREVRLTWSAVDKRLDRLVVNGQYLTALEMEEYRTVSYTHLTFSREQSR